MLSALVLLGLCFLRKNLVRGQSIYCTMFVHIWDLHFLMRHNEPILIKWVGHFRFICFILWRILYGRL